MNGRQGVGGAEVRWGKRHPGCEMPFLERAFWGQQRTFCSVFLISAVAAQLLVPLFELVFVNPRCCLALSQAVQHNQH